MNRPNKPSRTIYSSTKKGFWDHLSLFMLKWY